MSKILVFSVLVFVLGICVVSTTEKRRNNDLLSEAEIKDYISLNVVNKEFHSSGSDLEAPRSDVECSVERPCQNGGTCHYKICQCPWGIKGPLCEEIKACETTCENRLELDCHYHPSKQIAYCTCKNSSLFYDPEANICKPCSCENGYCEYSFNYFGQKLKCNCYAGYQEFNGYCKRCSCGYVGRCELDSKGKKICHCEKGFFEREGRCLSCGCMSYGDTYTECEVINNVKRCLCKEGYQDVFGECQDIDECETDNPCHPSTTCHNTYGSFECICPDGYKGSSGSKVKPGEVCNDIDECIKSPCWLWNNVKCVNLPGSYKCECDIGYEPSNKYMEPHKTSCVRTTKSWGPALIVLFTSIALIIVSVLMHRHVRNRAARSN